ncbi:MAG: hypothetical protein ACHQIM_04385 [Sphingobacteriales bacterium]
MLQFLQKQKAHRVLLLVTFPGVALLGILAFMVPPGADPDPCWGFMVMHSMEQGHHFNLLISPDPLNIAKDQVHFLSWWSPGQYLFPYLFKILLKIDTGHAVALTIGCCNIIGLAGYYKLFKKLGFTAWVAAISTTFIASQLFFFISFVYYLGGEVLLFAFMGWFLYGCFSFEKITRRVLVFVFLVFFAGFFSKSSFLWMYIAGVACLWINISRNETDLLPAKIARNLLRSPDFKKRTGVWLRNGMWLSIPLVGAFVIIYIFYLSKGPNPTAAGGQPLIRPETFGFPLASPMLSGFSIDEFTDGLIYQPDGAKIAYQSAVFIMAVFACCSLAFAFFLPRFSPDKKYVLVILVFYVFGVVFFSYMYLKQTAISYEGRHFRIIGLLFIPGFVYLVLKTKITRLLFFILWAFILFKSYSYFKGEIKANKAAARGNSGISQQLYDKKVLDEIVKIDGNHHNDAVFVVMSSDIAAEIINNRVITLDSENMGRRYLSKLKFAAKSGPLFILMPREYVANGIEPVIIKSFTGYHQFSFKQLSEDYYLYFADN